MRETGNHIQPYLLLACALLYTISAPGQSVFNTKYDAFNRSDRCYSVTGNDQNQIGAIWWNEKRDFGTSFSLDFVIYMGDKDPNGASGLAFIIHSDPRDTIDNPSKSIGNRKDDTGATVPAYEEGAFGEPSGGLGYASHPTDPIWNLKIAPSVAIEFDTYNNRDVPDGNNGKDGNGINWKKSKYFGWDHTSVIYNGDLFSGQQLIEDVNGNQDRILPLKPEYIYGSQNNPDGSTFHNIEDDRCYLFTVNWIVNGDGTQTIELWSNYYTGSDNTGNLGLVMRHTDAMLSDVFKGQQLLRWGFTGSTIDAHNEQTVCLLEQNNKPIAQDDYLEAYYATGTIFDILANDLEPDADHMYIPSIAVPPKNASASIFDSLGASYLRYIPNFGFSGTDSLAYVTCDANSTKCYSKCDTAWVYVDIVCLPFNVTAEMISANVMCTDTARANGAAQGQAYDVPYPGTLWFEGFSDMENATEDTGPTSWYFTTSGGCTSGNIIQVQKGRFRAKKTGCEVAWRSGPIDISTVSDVSITFDLWSSGNADINDYIMAFYVVDGGAEIPFDNGEFKGHFQIAKAATSNINGNTLEIVIRIKTTGQGSGDDNYFIDNILVQAVGAETALKYLWYEGDVVSDSVLQEGDILTNVTHGTYTVVAVDMASNCPSESYTVVIDSAGKGLPGGFIEQIAPLTTCALPYDGILEAAVINDSDTITSGYLFEWYFSEYLLVGAPMRIGPKAENLEARDYSVHIIDLTSGCDTIIPSEVDVAIQKPVLTAQTLADVRSCTHPNTGSAYAAVTGNETGIVYEWFSGPYVVGKIPDFTGPQVDSLETGTYAVVAIDTVTSCISPPEMVTINENFNYPIPVLTDVTDQVSCDSLAATGACQSGVLLGADTITDGHNFFWYLGQNDAIPARNGYNGGPDVDSLKAGTYRLVVTNDTTGCASFVDALIDEQINIPLIAGVDVLSITQCNTSPNGSILIHPMGDTSAFTYQIYKGTAITNDSLWLDSTITKVTGLPEGIYSITITDMNTGCQSEPFQVTIDDQTVLPAGSLTSTAQTSCDPANVNGNITVTPDSGDPFDYTFRWFEGDTTGIEIPGASGVNGEIMNGLDSGRFAVMMTHDATNCAVILYSDIAFSPSYPVIDSVRALPTSGCNAAVNGELRATVNGGSIDPTAYLFTWQDITTGTVIPDTLAQISGLDEGDYQLTVLDRSNGCTSVAPAVTIAREAITPEPVISVTHNVSCNPAAPTGIITVSGIGNGSPDLNDYRYSWYYDSLGGLQLISPDVYFSGTPDSAEVSGLDGGLYVLHIENKISECSNDVYVALNTLSYMPTIDAFNITHTAQCTAPYLSGVKILGVSNGTALTSQHQYEWTYVDGGSAVLPDSSFWIYDSLSTSYNLPPGNYRVRAFNEYNCPSDYLDFIIRDESELPVLNLQTFDNTSCDPLSNPNGIILAEIDTSGSAVADYSFAWNNVSTGTPVDPADISLTSTGQLGQALTTGNYRITIKHNTTLCTSSELGAIVDNTFSIPVIDTLFTQDVTSCLAPNGSIGLKVDSVYALPPYYSQNRAYTFYIEPGNAVTDTATAIKKYTNPSGTRPDTVLIKNNPAGQYTAIAIDQFTGCISLPWTVDLEESIQITIAAANKFQPTSCVNPDGMIELVASSPANNEGMGTTAGFTFIWLFHGNDPNNPGVPLLPANDGFETNYRSQKINLASGFYSITITDLESGCITIEKCNLDPKGLPPILVVTANDADQCIPGNGSVAFQMDSLAGVNPVEDYVIYLYQGNLIDPLAVVDSIIPAPGFYPYADIFADLQQSDYAIVVRENFGAGDCYSSPVSLTIGYSGPNPSLTPEIISVDKACSGAAAGTGQLTEASLPVSGYEFIWYTGRDTTASSGSAVHGSPDQSDPTSWIDDNPTTSPVLWGGVYTLVARDYQGPGLGCKTTVEINLPKVQTSILIADNPVTPKDACTIDNGSAYVHTITENNGPEFMVDTTDYRYFELIDADFNILQNTPAGPGPYLGGPGLPFSDLNAGYYYLRTKNTVTNCYSAPKSINITDVASSPTVNIVLASADYNCTGPDPTGNLIALVNGDTLQSEYNVSWYQGTDTTIVPVSTNFSATGLTANMSSQLYTVVVEDINALNADFGCKTIRNQTLIHQPTEVLILRGDLLIDPITTCDTNPDGNVLVNAINEIFPNGDTVINNPSYSGMFDIQLLNKLLKPINPALNPYAFFDVNTGSFNNMPEGTYYVRSQNIITGCAFGPPIQIAISDNSRNPLADLAVSQLDYACTGGTHTGILEISSLAGGSDGDDDPAHFSYLWVSNQTGDSTQTTGSLPPDAIRVASGHYTLYTIDLSGADSLCQSEDQIFVPKGEKQLGILEAYSRPQYVCYDDGSVYVNEIYLGTSSVSLPDPMYEVHLYDNSWNNVGGTVPGTGTLNDPYRQLHPGGYYIEIHDSLTNCSSAPQFMVVRDSSSRPVIASDIITPQYSLNPDPTSWTGMIAAQAMEADASIYPQGYSFEWYMGIGTSSMPISSDTAIAGLDVGLYTIHATSDSTLCSASKSIYLPFKYLRPQFEPLPDPQTVCSPDNGRIRIEEIFLEGDPDDLPDYTFYLSIDSYQTGNWDMMTPGTNPQVLFDTLGPGDYYIIARENLWWVQSYPIQVKIEDESTEPIIFLDTDNYQPLTACDPSIDANGVLALMVSEEDGSIGSYNYIWFDDSGSIIPGANNSTIGGLNAGDYTVNVLNTSTNCSVNALFNVADERNIPIAAIAANAATNCDPLLPNGVLSGSVINTLQGTYQSRDYTFNWYEGDTIKAIPDYSGQIWQPKNPGIYTLQVINISLPTCISEPVVKNLMNELQYPEITVQELSPLTNCDPAKANAIITARANGSQNGYLFEWYLKDGPWFFTGPSPSGLGDTTYRVVVRDLYTGCTNERDVKPSETYDIVANPEVIILSPRTSCLQPNGSARAFVPGNLGVYTFEYNDRHGNILPQDNDIVYDLDSGIYAAVAISQITGCSSDPKPFVMSNAFYYPQFDILTTPSTCEAATGSAELVVHRLDKYYKPYWSDENGYLGNDDYVDHLDIGRYQVEVEGTEGCFTFQEFEIRGDIIIYNGVSDNSDGLNDYFQIVCLDIFPQNNVKIFNRTGVLVFEMDQYDMNNPGKRFNGEGNRGIYFGNKELPIGTYYYVVDKGDGSEASVGYLELKR